MGGAAHLEVAAVLIDRGPAVLSELVVEGTVGVGARIAPDERAVDAAVGHSERALANAKLRAPDGDDRAFGTRTGVLDRRGRRRVTFEGANLLGGGGHGKNDRGESRENRHEFHGTLPCLGG